jgi:hypothetical protein
MYQWGRAVWAFDNDGAAWVQGFAALVSASITAILATLTACSLRYTRLALKASGRQAFESARQVDELRNQLRLMAHPNVAVSIEVADSDRLVRVTFTNRGAYPVLVRNVYLQQTIGGEYEFRRRLGEVDGVTISSGSASITEEFLTRSTEMQIDMGPGFSDFVEVEYECSDTVGLVSERYVYQNLFGARALPPATAH